MNQQGGVLVGGDLLRPQSVAISASLRTAFAVCGLRYD